MAELNIKSRIALFINWLRWAIELKTIPIWEVCWVSHRELTEAEKEYPLTRMNEIAEALAKDNPIPTIRIKS